MKNMKKLFLTVLSMSALMVSACSGGTVEDSSSAPSSVPSQSSTPSSTSSSSDPIPVSITLDKTTAALGVGETLTITATATGGTVTWESSDTDIATVANGVVTGVAEGYARIIATIGSVSATCQVRVDADPDNPDDPIVDPEVPATARGAIIIAGGTPAAPDWTDTTTVDLFTNPGDENEVMATNVKLYEDQIFFINFDTTEYRHHDNLKYGGASTSFESFGDDKNFKVLEEGTYSFYIQKEFDPAAGSVWVEGVVAAPTFEKYTVAFGNGEPIELSEVALDDDDVESNVIKKYTAHIAILTAGEAITFKGGEETLYPGDENIEGKDHNGNNTIGQFPYYFVHNDASGTAMSGEDIYLKVYADGYSFWLTGYNKDAEDPNVPELPVPVDEAATYYLVGQIGGVEDWGSTKYEFERNTYAGEDVEEYQLKEEIELKAGDSFKIFGSTNAWYPSGDNVTIAKDGVYQIYFRPAGNSEWTQAEGYLFVYKTASSEDDTELKGYFLKGSMNRWEAEEDYQLAVDPEDEHKLFIKLDLHQGDQLKVFSTDGETDHWYPEGDIAYKTSGGSAVEAGHLTVLGDGNLAVVVPGYYFIEINTSGDNKGIWTKLESKDDALMLDALELSTEGGLFTAGVFKKTNDKYQYEFVSDYGISCVKDDEINFRWQSEAELKFALGNAATEALIAKVEGKAAVKVLADSAKLNFFFAFEADGLKLYVAEVVPQQSIAASIDEAYFADGAVAYVWAWKGSGDGAWYAYDATNKCFKVPADCDHLIVVRMNPTGAPSWEAKWNQTSNMTIEAGKTLTYKSLTEFEWK